VRTRPVRVWTLFQAAQDEERHESTNWKANQACYKSILAMPCIKDRKHLPFQTMQRSHNSNSERREKDDKKLKRETVTFHRIGRDDDRMYQIFFYLFSSYSCDSMTWCQAKRMCHINFLGEESYDICMKSIFRSLMLFFEVLLFDGWYCVVHLVALKLALSIWADDIWSQKAITLGYL